MDHHARVTRFQALHQQGCFILANPWDAGSARALASMGFSALATSSAALAYVLGRPEAPGTVSLEETLANLRDIQRATDLPVNADFQAGYAETAEGVGLHVGRCIETGVAGLSIEDATGDVERPLFELAEAVERMQAAREAIDHSGLPVVLTGRAESFLVGHETPLQDAITRLIAYAEAGADCLYAPGLRTQEEVRAVVEAVAPRPVNVLAADPRWMTLDALGALGVRRISIGSALARVGWGAVLGAAQTMVETGAFRDLSSATPFQTLDALFAEDDDVKR